MPVSQGITADSHLFLQGHGNRWLSPILLAAGLLVNRKLDGSFLDKAADSQGSIGVTVESDPTGRWTPAGPGVGRWVGNRVKGLGSDTPPG